MPTLEYDHDHDRLYWADSKGNDLGDYHATEDDDPDEEFVIEEPAVAQVVGRATPPPPTATKNPLGPTTLAAIAEYRLMSTKKLLTLPEPGWFIEKLIPQAPRTVVHGTGGARKSFMVLDWMLCAAHGLDWHGFKIEPGKVLYMAGEGVSGIPRRLRAWASRHDMQAEDLNVDWMPVPINLTQVSSEQVDHWAQFVAYMNYRYIVVDTLHTAMTGGEENSSSDIARVYDTATRIAGPNCSLIFIHHSPKAAKKTARGSSSIRDSVDNVIHCDDVGDETTKVIADKIRDADKFKPLQIVYEEVELDDDNTSLVSKHVTFDQGSATNNEMSKRDRIRNVLLAEPNIHTIVSLACMVNDGKPGTKAIGKVIEQMLDEDSIVLTEIENPKRGRGHQKTIWVTSFDEDNERFTLDDSDEEDEVFDRDN